MSQGYRIVFETYSLDNPNDIKEQSVIIEDIVTRPTSCLDFSISHEQQIEILQNSIDHVIAEKTKLINSESGDCPNCSKNLIKLGYHRSTFHDVFTDHHVRMQRLRCKSCKYEAPSTVRTLLDGVLSGALVKRQSELGSDYTFREAESLLEKFATKRRSINNRNRIKNIVSNVGTAIEAVDRTEQELLEYEDAEELILNIDGGHVKTVEEQRSIEALTSVVYKPESLMKGENSSRRYLTSKSCAASVKDDNQKEIINNTIIAAMKEGLTADTKITALCDGAANCWKVVDALKPLCGSMTCILDWFHITMKMQNIALPEPLKDKFLKIKWHLWRGNVDSAITRLEQLISLASDTKTKNKLDTFKAYINNNYARIVNYRERKKNGLVFTSNLAESTVESLVNRRCKGQQHMRWSREGLNPILQLRAKMHTQDWDNKWKTVILNSTL